MRSAARDVHLRALDLQVHGLGREGLGDVRQQPARDEDDPLLLDVGGDLAASRYLVIEGRQDQ